MFALDVSQINWRTIVAHVPTEDISPIPAPVTTSQLQGRAKARRA
jgi:hypothetical protein